MESLGKEKDLDGKVVHQGIAVYGNKGSTDQHAYVQQLRDGVPNFFVTFIEVRKDRAAATLRSRAGRDQRRLSAGLPARHAHRALRKRSANRSPSPFREVDAFQVGALIALYERAVGFYGSLVNINAYHQPGVEAGKESRDPNPGIAAQVLAQTFRRPAQTAEADRASYSRPTRKTCITFCATWRRTTNRSSIRAEARREIFSLDEWQTCPLTVNVPTCD